MNRLDARQVQLVVLPAVGVENCDLTPPTGHAYLVISVYGFHNEGAALNCLWAYDDGLGGGFRNLQTSGSVASGVFHHFYSATGAQTRDSFVLRAGQTLRWNAALLGAAKQGCLVAVVDEWVGETPYVG